MKPQGPLGEMCRRKIVDRRLLRAVPCRCFDVAIVEGDSTFWHDLRHQVLPTAPLELARPVRERIRLRQQQQARVS